MKKKKFILRNRLEDGVSERTIYNWKKNYDGLGFVRVAEVLSSLMRKTEALSE